MWVCTAPACTNMHQPAGAEGNNVVKWLGKLWWGGGRWRGRRMDISASRDSPRLPAAPRDSPRLAGDSLRGHFWTLRATSGHCCICTVHRHPSTTATSVVFYGRSVGSIQAGRLCMYKPTRHACSLSDSTNDLREGRGARRRLQPRSNFSRSAQRAQDTQRRSPIVEDTTTDIAIRGLCRRRTPSE
jgi:hypothetical protein